MSPIDLAGERSRRQFFKELAAGGGLVLGLAYGAPLQAALLESVARDPEGFRPNAFIQILANDQITIYGKHDEMGQGIHTGLAIAIVEELEIDVDRVKVVPAPAGAAYANSAFQVQVTGGSTSTWSSFDQMRQAGAVARTMLVAAAAAEWGVSANECVAKNGAVVRRDGSAKATYGQLAARAATMTVPKDVPLKPASEFTRIGKPTRRVDSADKVRGKSIFSMDRRAPGRLTAMVARCSWCIGISSPRTSCSPPRER